jgi:hypothetical protein
MLMMIIMFPVILLAAMAYAFIDMFNEHLDYYKRCSERYLENGEMELYEYAQKKVADMETKTPLGKILYIWK